MTAARTLTDADVEAIAAALVRQLRDEREADRAEKGRRASEAYAAIIERRLRGTQLPLVARGAA